MHPEDLARVRRARAPSQREQLQAIAEQHAILRHAALLHSLGGEGATMSRTADDPGNSRGRSVSSVWEPLDGDIVGKTEAHASERIAGGNGGLDVGGFREGFVDFLGAVGGLLGMQHGVMEGHVAMVGEPVPVVVRRLRIDATYDRFALVARDVGY
jgi:hypothetical protein